VLYPERFAAKFRIWTILRKHKILEAYKTAISICFKYAYVFYKGLSKYNKNIELAVQH
jgi:hypothetical protein